MNNRNACKIVLAVLGIGCIIIGFLLKKRGFPLIGAGLALLTISTLV